jgi:hypothetical protein
VNEPTPHPDHPEGRLSLRVEDSDTYQLVAAARELEAHLLHEQARRLADVRAMLVELYQRDGVAVDDALLDAQAEDVDAQERAERFLGEVATRIHPGAELLELASQLDDHGLGVWREAAASLVEACPPCLLSWRWRVEEEQRAELRGHGHLVRSEAHLGGVLRRLGMASRLRHRGRVGRLRGELATCRTLRERSETRLAFMDAKLLVIDRTEQARATWIHNAHQVLARGVAAAQILAGRQQQPESKNAHGGEPVGRTAAGDGRRRPRVAS